MFDLADVIIHIPNCSVIDVSNIEYYEPPSRNILIHRNSRPWKYEKIKPPYHVVVVGSKQTAKALAIQRSNVTSHSSSKHWAKLRAKLINILTSGI